MSPSYFESVNGNAREWNQNSAGYLSPWNDVNTTNGARPDSYQDRSSSMSLKINGYGC